MRIFSLDRPVFVAASLALAFNASPSQAQWQAPAYELRLRPDFETKTVAAQAVVSLRRGAQLEDELRLSAPALEIHSAGVDGIALSPEKHDGYWLIKMPPLLAARLDMSLKLDYLARAGEGLVFGPDYVYTAFHTCRWLPCLGSDLGRASLKTTLELPAGFSSLASGVPVAPQPVEQQQQQQWLEAAPYPLYTLGFAAGRFTRTSQSVDGKELHYLSVGDDAAALQSKFKTTPAMLAFFSAKAGLTLPHPAYSQLLLPGGVAQEMSSYAAIGHKMLDPILENEQEDWVIAHELAHQWWGTWISCEQWSEFWLNEGITVFMTAAWKQQRWGEAAYQRELDIATRGWQRAKDAGFDKPLSWPGDYPSLSLKRSIHYSKGALFMHALRQDMGEEAFWAGFKRYSQNNAGRQVRAGDLQAAMEAAAGRSLQPLFDAWVYAASTGQ
ncbi:M1 family metallopeptidase [Roseateles oligotrophus]|uniref:Peptidase M1 membrane alanine aminopeptidase domain-containing protein n=1 Tax=Roseateles oligotrophus TaxID=1769250 RepID=A0ABT2YGL8_9BURK|nr:M1 family aminopeptidase [Roseateles oligotrophus]MCV2369199.1 hypothetical protein [Roseateles oligotrophus]